MSGDLKLVSLTAQDAEVVHSYLETMSIARTANALGLSPAKTRLIINSDRVQEWLKESAHANKAVEVNKERVLGHVADMALASISDLVDDNGEMLPLHQVPESAARAIKSYKQRTVLDPETGGVKGVEVSVTMHEKSSYIKVLTEMAGLNKEQAGDVDSLDLHIYLDGDDDAK